MTQTCGQHKDTEAKRNDEARGVFFSKLRELR
jgi:hypothetical protein